MPPERIPNGLHIGVIGLGRAGLMHARNLSQHPGVAKVTVLGRDQQRVNQGKAALAAAIAPGSDSSLAGAFAPASSEVELASTTAGIAELAADLDGLVVATTTPTHPAMTRAAVAAGLPVLVEKPLTLDVAELTELAVEFDEAPVMVAFHRRYDPAHQALRARLAAGEAGTLRIVRAVGHDRPPLPLDYIPKSGGMWLDMLIHDFDAIPWLTGQRVVRVQAAGGALDEPEFERFDDIDTAAAILTLESGALALISGTRRNGAGQDVRLEVFGSRNTFGVGIEPRTPVTSTEPGVPGPAAPYPDFIDRFERAFRSEIDHFLALVRGDSAANLTPPAAGRHAVEIARAAGQSRVSGQPVDLPRSTGIPPLL